MELQESIMLAAMDEFKEKDLKFTMNDIAKRLKISKKTIYTVYESKEALFDAIADYIYGEIKKKEEEVLSKDIDIVQKIKEVIIALPDNCRDLDFTKLLSLKDKYPHTYNKVVKNIESNWDSTFDLIMKGVEQKRIRPVNLVILKAMISATMEHLLSSDELSVNNIQYTDALDEMMNIIMKGLTYDE